MTVATLEADGNKGKRVDVHAFRRLPNGLTMIAESGVGRIIEVVSGMPYDQFLSSQLFEPLGMKDSRFYPGEKLQERIVTLYSKNKDTGELQPVPPRGDLASRDRPPLATSGLYSTAPDIARFCQMLLNGGELDGRRYLKPETIKLFELIQSGGVFHKLPALIEGNRNEPPESENDSRAKPFDLSVSIIFAVEMADF